MEQLQTLWFDDLNQKEFLSLSLLLVQRLGFFLMNFNKKKVEIRHLLLAKDGLQGSNNAYRFIA
jgi:hypothetical protein